MLPWRKFFLNAAVVIPLVLHGSLAGDAISERSVSTVSQCCSQRCQTPHSDPIAFSIKRSSEAAPAPTRTDCSQELPGGQGALWEPTGSEPSSSWRCFLLCATSCHANQLLGIGLSWAPVLKIHFARETRESGINGPSPGNPVWQPRAASASLSSNKLTLEAGQGTTYI